MSASLNHSNRTTSGRPGFLLVPPFDPDVFSGLTKPFSLSDVFTSRERHGLSPRVPKTITQVRNERSDPKELTN